MTSTINHNDKVSLSVKKTQRLSQKKIQKRSNYQQLCCSYETCFLSGTLH